MGKLIVSENTTLDGSVRDPTGEEGAPRGGWFAQVSGVDRAAFGQAALDEALAADAFLMGRRTYDFLASRWPARTGALAERLNSIAKYVVSATLTDPAWDNTRVIEGDPATQIVALKESIKGEIVVPASFQLVRTVFEHGLVDELTIVVYPFLLGTEGSLFGRLPDKISLRLLGTGTLGDHLTRTRYEVVHRSGTDGLPMLRR